MLGSRPCTPFSEQAWEVPSVFGQHFRGVLRVTLSIVRDELGPSPTHVLKP